MKTLLALAVAATLALTASASAADLWDTGAGFTDVETVELASNWTGAYVGIGVRDILPLNNISEVQPSVYAGYDYHTGPFLVGVEAEILNHNNDFYGSLLGKAGVVVTDNVAVYGVAGGEVNLQNTTTRQWFVGGGASVAVTDNVNLDALYTYGVDTQDHRVRVGVSYRF